MKMMLIIFIALSLYQITVLPTIPDKTRVRVLIELLGLAVILSSIVVTIGFGSVFVEQKLNHKS